MRLPELSDPVLMVETTATQGSTVTYNSGSGPNIHELSDLPQTYL